MDLYCEALASELMGDAGCLGAVEGAAATFPATAIKHPHLESSEVPLVDFSVGNMGVGSRGNQRQARDDSDGEDAGQNELTKHGFLLFFRGLSFPLR
jgi:hypothetical protein